MALSTPPAGTILGSATYPHLSYHSGLTEVRYVHPSGDNTKDGLSWGTAKADVGSAYDALPSTGGVVYIADGSMVDSTDSTKGLWLCGPEDAQYASPSGGWRRRKQVAFIGEGGGGSPSNFSGGPIVRLGGGHTTDRTKPGLWIAGLGGALRFENIQFNGGGAVNIRLGINSTLTQTIDSSMITFRGCSNQLNLVAGHGPALELGYLYWFHFYDCTWQANPTPYVLTAATRSGTTGTFTTSITHALEVGDTVQVYGVTPSGYNGVWTVTAVTSTTFVATLTVDPGGSGTVFGSAIPIKSYRRAVMASDPNRWATGWADAWFFSVENSIFNQGGIYYKPAGNIGSGSVELRNITVEGDGTYSSPPAILIRPEVYGYNRVVGAADAFHIQNVLMADIGGVFNVPAVEVEGSLTDPKMTVVEFATAVGNVTQYPSMNARQQSGIDNGEFIGYHSGHKRSFAPATARYVNSASHTLSGGSWTTGVSAPNGTTNASSLTNAQTAAQFMGGATYAVGDWVIFGIWRRQVVLSTSDNNDYPIYQLGDGGAGEFDSSAANYFILLNPHKWEDGGWAWYAEAHRITASGATNATITFRSVTGSTVAYFAPISFRIPTGTLDDDEVYELIRNLQTYPSTAPAGSLSALAGQKLLVPAGIGVGNSASATTPGSVVRKMEVFDDSGASLGFVPIYSSIT